MMKSIMVGCALICWGLTGNAFGQVINPGGGGNTGGQGNGGNSTSEQNGYLPFGSAIKMRPKDPGAGKPVTEAEIAMPSYYLKPICGAKMMSKHRTFRARVKTARGSWQDIYDYKAALRLPQVVQGSAPNNPVALPIILHDFNPSENYPLELRSWLNSQEPYEAIKQHSFSTRFKGNDGLFGEIILSRALVELNQPGATESRINIEITYQVPHPLLAPKKTLIGWDEKTPFRFRIERNGGAGEVLQRISGNTGWCRGVLTSRITWQHAWNPAEADIRIIREFQDLKGNWHDEDPNALVGVEKYEKIPLIAPCEIK